MNMKKYGMRMKLMESAPAEVSTPAGGGSAPAATVTPAAAPQGGMWGGGIRHQIKLPEATPAPATPAAVETPPATPPATPAPAAPVSTPSAYDPAKQVFKFMGREYVGEKAIEDAMRRSQEEGIRLYQDNKKILESHAKELATREAKAKEIQAELEFIKQHGVFKEKSKEELAEMKEKEYVDYMLTKNERDRQMASEKQAREEGERSRQAKEVELERVIRQRDVQMSQDPKTYPGYDNMKPVAAQLIELSGGKESPFIGHPLSGEFLYLAGKGLLALQAEQAGDAAKTQAAEEAAAKARASAAASGAPATTTTTITDGGAAKDPDAEHKAAMVSLHGKRWLGALKS